MAKQKQKWTSEEEEALRAGVEKHGTGKWRIILADPQFASSLANRSNIDLKDKWRNLSVSGNVPGSREKVRTPRLQGLAINPPLSSPEPLSAIPLLEYDGAAEPSGGSLDKKIAPKCNAMIFEALSLMEDSNGSDVNAILGFIEQRYEVPQNFRRSLTTKLRRLVLQGKLEKVDNCYKIKATSSGAETSNQKDATPNKDESRNDKQKAPQSSASPIATETLEDAALYAAYAVARAENLSHEAAEACEEADRLAKIAEGSMAMLKLAEELYEQCLNSADGMVLLDP